MLVLARRKHEVIRIGKDIKITVADIYGGKVSIGVDAPNDVPVHREEVYQTIHGGGNPPEK